MATNPSASNKPYHVRSISLPSRSHPLSLRVEEGLHKLKTWATTSLPQASSPSAEVLCVALEGLQEMYESMEELLRLPHIQQAITRHRGEKWVSEELDSSVKLLDICGEAKDAVSTIKGHAQELQSVLRIRREGDSNLENKIGDFVRSRKKAHKDSCKCLKYLKQMEERCPIYPLPAADQDLSLALEGVKQVREITVVILRSLSSFLSKPASSSWLPISRAWEKENNTTSELDKVDALLRSINGKVSRKDVEHGRVQGAQQQLHRLENGMESLETGLESLFRRLIQSRVSLLDTFNP